VCAAQVVAFFFAVYGVWDAVALASGGASEVYGGASAIGWAWGVAIMASSVAVFVVMDVVKVWVYRAWSFELTARLVPTRARVSKLKQRAELRILSQRVARNVERARNVLRIINVLQHFKSYKPPHYAVIKQALPKGHH
jgi:hypothetical protein